MWQCGFRDFTRGPTTPRPRNLDRLLNMAEGVQFATPNTRYFCHKCSQEVSLLPIYQAQLICPECSSNFLEEFSSRLYDVGHLAISDDDQYDSEIEEPSSLDLTPPSPPNWSMESVLNRMFMQAAGVESPQPPVESDDESVLFGFDEIPAFIQRITGVELSDDSDEDYARRRYLEDFTGEDEVDAIASQLLDEVVVSGPPPLEKDQIKALPTITLTKKHIEKGLQCTVCMDDFRQREKAKSLPCEHLYHEKCITPWLERQGTCPNCRGLINVENDSWSLMSRSSAENSDSIYPNSSVSRYFTTSMNPFLHL